MDILNLSLCVTEILILFAFFNSLFQRRRKNVLILLIVALSNAFIVFELANVNTYIKSVINIACIIIGSVILIKEKIYVISAFSLLSIYIFYITDVIFGNVFSIVLGQSFLGVFYQSFANRLIVCYIIKAVNAALFYLLYKMFSKVEINLGKSKWLVFNVIIGALYFISLMFIYIYPQNSSSDNIVSALFLIISASFFAMSVLVLYFYAELCASFQEKKKLYILETSFAAIEEKMTMLSQTSEKLKKIRHDIHNHLVNALVMIKSGKTNEAYRLVTDVEKCVDDISVDISSSSGNSVIDAVIAYKAAVAEKRKISFEYKLETLPNMNIDFWELSSVLSNLLDNAFEASSKDEAPRVSLKIYIYKKYLTIIISNSCPPNSEKPSDSFLTSKEDKENHGFGHKIIEEIALKYNGSVNYSIKDNKFTVVVILNI